MNKYFFGYLFVRIAKLLAVLILVIGACYGFFKLAQGSNAAESVTYQPSVALRQHLDKLAERFAETKQLLAASSKAQSATEEGLKFGSSISSQRDFATLADELDRLDKMRQAMKQTLMSPFESLVFRIEEKLRAHAAAVAPAVMLPASPNATPFATPSQSPAPVEAATLFSANLSQADLTTRLGQVDQGKQFLETLRTTAESETNKHDLASSIEQLEALRKLLPSPQTSATAEEQPSATPTSQVVASPPREPLNAEKVAIRLSELRGSIRRAILSSWTLDEEYEQTAELASTEQYKCRAAMLAVKGIWLSTMGQIAGAIVGAAFIAFLVLVLADLTQTLLDTASNTGVIAEASGGRPQASNEPNK